MRRLLFHRLFFALRPPLHAVREIAEARDASNLAGAAVRDEHLHLTLFMLGGYPATPFALIDRLVAAMSGSALPACRILFDSFVAARRSSLIRPSEPLTGLQALHLALRHHLAVHRIGAVRGWRFDPHVTLIHRPRRGEGPPLYPIAWTAGEMVLIESLVGLTKHLDRGRWPLGPGL